MGQRLGQHFLKDQNALENIASSLEIKPGDFVIEIGPGHGELTRFLLDAKPQKLIAIEKDLILADELESGPDIEVVKGDVLETLQDVVSNLKGKPYKLTGNIPYYITGYLMRTLERLEPKPNRIVLTIQKEVAERICSVPPKMNLLAASVQFWSDPSIVGILKKGSFSPPPKVDSAILLIEPAPAKYKISSERYYRFIKILFKQPRKNILNNLREGLEIERVVAEEKLKALNIDSNRRPGDMSLAEITSLADVFSLIA